MRTINLIVIHCSATPSGKPIARGTPGKPGFLNAAQVIDSWHAVRSFKRTAANLRLHNGHLPSIGYHYVIDIDGTVLSGRHEMEVGAHAAGHNASSIGICLVGGVEPKTAAYTPAQWDSLARLVRRISVMRRIPLAPARRSGKTLTGGICGHRDLSPDINNNGIVEPHEWLKTCPGFDVAKWLAAPAQPLAGHVL
jgi:N-acetylmuramoyl-L-alanine amidase